MKNVIHLLFAIALGAFPFQKAMAGELSVVESEDSSLTLILIEGEIEAGDERSFRQLALQNENAIVILESPGGAVGPALEIGKAISVSGFSTAVLGGSSCTSACALIWLAGSVRGLSRDARLGFHASYRDEDGVAIESGAANALIGQYLTQLGLPSKAILFATLAPPNDFLWLDESTRDQSGIVFRLIDDDNNSDSETVSGQTASPLTTPQTTPPATAFEERLRRYPKEWVTKKAAENGLDVTPDGRIWFNSDIYGDAVDYGVSAEDLWTAKGRFRKAWVRGYHARDPSVAYNESLQFIHADCAERMWGSEMTIYYDENGKMLDQITGRFRWQPVVPRTYSESWFSMICSD